MPPKPKEKDKKKPQLKTLKEIIPANSKPARDPLIGSALSPGEIERNFHFYPYKLFPKWPGNEAALVIFKS
jgi:hypothetical protein